MKKTRITYVAEVSETISEVLIWTKFCFPISHRINIKFREHKKMIKLLKIILLLNIFLLSQAYVRLPTVTRSGNYLQNEFNALMRKKSAPSFFGKYLQYLQINNLQLSQFKKGLRES